MLVIINSRFTFLLCCAWSSSIWYIGLVIVLHVVIAATKSGVCPRTTLLYYSANKDDSQEIVALISYPESAQTLVFSLV
jgi:hypothetical protein